jgi:Flp pilus assembly protein TadG
VISRRLFRCESGASLVEFALLAPVLIFLLVGVIEIGRYTYYAIIAANAARAGVAYGAQNLTTAAQTGTTGLIAQAAQADAQNISQFSANVTDLCSINGGALGACSSASSPSAGTVYYVQVVVNGTFTTLLHYPGIPTNVPITGSATMRVQSQ